MKKVLIATALLLSSGYALAGDHHKAADGGFSGPTLGAKTSIATALAAGDDTQVQITGNITNALGGDEYQFTDGTNTIVIEIEDYVWKGVDVTPTDKVTITGELEKDFWEEATIEVEKVAIAI